MRISKKVVAQLRNTYKDRLLEALNLIDEQAEQGGGNKEEKIARAEAYQLIYDFIDNRL